MPAQIDSLAAASAALIGGSTADEASEPINSIRSWGSADWRKALLDLPLDERDFHNRFLASRRATIGGLWRWWSDRRARPSGLTPEATGYLGFFLLTVVSMHCSDRMRFHGEPAGTIRLDDTDADAICRALVEERHVRQAIKQLYNPNPPRFSRRRQLRTPSSVTLKEWHKIDFGSLGFHRHGTTSIILTGRESGPSKGRTARFALKCLIFPYQSVPAIAAATREYLANYGQLGTDASPLVSVWASHDSWILMDFVQGQTLAEYLRDQPEPPRPKREILRPVRIEQLESLGNALLRALAELESENRHHDDLSPSNIIIEDHHGPGDKRMRLIDLGPNHLHTRAVTGASQGEAVYVAPEVREEGIGSGQADLFSLGKLLISIGGIDLNPDGTLPDQFYVTSVGLARLLEDLIDTDPDRRLLVSGIDPEQNRYSQIAILFRNEMEVVRESARTAPVGWWERLKSASPGAGTVARQRAILKVRNGQDDTAAGSFHLRQSRRRMRWTWLCSVLIWCTTAVVVTWWARDLGIAWQAKWLELLNNVFNRSGPGLVFFDDIRASDYPIPDPWGNLPARIIGATFTLVNARLYLNVFADLSPWSSLPRKGMLRLRTVATEVGLRTFAVLPSICVLVPTLVQRDWWPLATQVGLVSTAVIVAACVWFQRDAHRRARAAGLSTVPNVEVPPGRLGQWLPILMLYCVPILGIGTLIMLDVLHDELVYAGFVSLINVAIYYFKSAGTDAPLVRTEMSRAFLAAERLDYLQAGRRAGPPSQREETPALVSA